MSLTQLAIKEAENLKTLLTAEEKLRLNWSTLDGASMEQQCFYGQLTGDTDSIRAISLIIRSTPTVVCNDVARDGLVVEVKELIELAEAYFTERVITKSVEWEPPMDDEDEEQQVWLVNPQQRSLYYLSPLEHCMPGLQSPDREETIIELRTILGV